MDCRNWKTFRMTPSVSEKSIARRVKVRRLFLSIDIALHRTPRIHTFGVKTNARHVPGRFAWRFAKRISARCPDSTSDCPNSTCDALATGRCNPLGGGVSPLATRHTVCFVAGSERFEEERVGTYLITELGDHESKPDSVVGLEAATYRAERRARGSERHIVVRSADTGREVARFPPGKGSSPPETTERKVTSDALLRLKETNQRLQDIVAPLPKRKDKDKDKGKR
jgi:hypothetical protein